MELDNDDFISTCISCNGTGKINCDCGTDEGPNIRCVTCLGEGNFKCPVCEGYGKL